MIVTGATAKHDDFERIDARDFWDAHLPKLSEDHRRAVIAWAQGKTTAEIAAAQGISPDLAKQRVCRGLRRLRERELGEQHIRRGLRRLGELARA